MLTTCLFLITEGDTQIQTYPFRGFQHDVAGDVEIVDQNTIVIHNFEYDGQGPDAFFVVGLTSNKPKPPTDSYPVPHPPVAGNK